MVAARINAPIEAKGEGEKDMLTRRTFAAAMVAALAMPSLAFAQATTPSAATI